jgi:hypothetical protein
MREKWLAAPELLKAGICRRIQAVGEVALGVVEELNARGVSQNIHIDEIQTATHWWKGEYEKWRRPIGDGWVMDERPGMLIPEHYEDIGSEKSTASMRVPEQWRSRYGEALLTDGTIAHFSDTDTPNGRSSGCAPSGRHSIDFTTGRIDNPSLSGIVHPEFITDDDSLAYVSALLNVCGVPPPYDSRILMQVGYTEIDQFSAADGWRDKLTLFAQNGGQSTVWP